MPPDKLLLDTASIAQEAGRLILPFFQGHFAHRLKADNSPVTEADLAAHAFLVGALGRLGMGLPVISEESSEGEAKAAPVTGDYWLVDPLDGTKDFMKGKPEFTVNIALMRKHTPMLGVVHAPALGVTYLAESGQEAWRVTGEGAAAQIRTRAADVQRLTVVASRDHSGLRVKRMLEKLPSAQVTSIGSSLKFCLIAEGKADLYFRDVPTMEWDTAAAQCVVETAGGVVVELNGELLSYGKPGLKNPGLVALGDPDFQWGNFAAGPENIQAFRTFFGQVCGEAGVGSQ